MQGINRIAAARRSWTARTRTWQLRRFEHLSRGRRLASASRGTIGPALSAAPANAAFSRHEVVGRGFVAVLRSATLPVVVGRRRLPGPAARVANRGGAQYLTPPEGAHARKAEAQRE